MMKSMHRLSEDSNKAEMEIEKRFIESISEIKKKIASELLFADLCFFHNETMDILKQLTS